MTGKFTRENGEVLILTEKELNSVYPYARVAWMKDFVCDMLADRGIDSDKLISEKIEEITEKYINNMSDYFGDSLGSLEYEVFDYTIENDYPELEEDDEEDDRHLITAKCSCCGREEEYLMSDAEYKTLEQYFEHGREMGKLQDLFPNVPAWIRSGAIDQFSSGFCICPECSKE